RRGVQPLASWARMRHLPSHRFEPYSEAESTQCGVCGFDEEVFVDAAEELEPIAKGIAVTGISLFAPRFLVDLQDFVARPAPPSPTAMDRKVLAAVLEVAASMPANATPGQLEKRLATDKVIPRADRWARSGVLHTLSVVGVLPNSHRPPP